MINTSGLEPLGRAVLVTPYLVEAMTSGGLYLPPDVRKKDQMAEQRAIVVKAGPLAWRDEPSPRAYPGDRILFSKYSGYTAIGPADGKEYRIVNDSDIFMRISQEKENGS